MRALALLYAGALLGHSFIATPAKFLARELTTGELLLVGRATFSTFAWVEGAMIVALLVAGRACKGALLLVAVVAAIALIQHLWLRPILDVRVAAILAGAEETPTPRHHVYAALELVKLALLLVIGLGQPRRAMTCTTDASPV